MLIKHLVFNMGAKLKLNMIIFHGFCGRRLHSGTFANENRLLRPWRRLVTVTSSSGQLHRQLGSFPEPTKPSQTFNETTRAIYKSPTP